MLKKNELFLSCFFLPLLVNATGSVNPENKLYVALEDLTLDHNGIWFKVPVDAVIVGASSIHIDSLGYYVANDEQIWVCPKCSRRNAGPCPGVRGCQKCGWPFNDTHLRF